jgi:dTDP-4-amino-4,6-dideoxygalactose transaminase
MKDVFFTGEVLKDAIKGEGSAKIILDRVKRGELRGWASVLSSVFIDEVEDANLSLIPLRPSHLKEAEKLKERNILYTEIASALSFGIDCILVNNPVEIGNEKAKIMTPEDFLKTPFDSSPIPFVDLKGLLHEIYNPIDESFTDIITSSAFVMGKYVKDFEGAFSRYIGVRETIACNSGTSALILPLLAYGIGPGDEVITVPFTFIATAEAISFVGARPVFVDIDEKTYNIDPTKIEEAITDRTKAIIPVHLYGQTAPMDPIMEIAEKYNLIVIEDACQSHGALYYSERNGKWMKAGSIGHAAAFSFYPGKNLGAMGEGGAVTTNDPDIAEKMRSLRDHGSFQKYYHHYKGLNLRMENFQGAVLLSKLPHLDEWNEKRREKARIYDRLFRDVEGVITPYTAPYSRHIYHLYVIRVRKRDELRNYLSEREIGTGIHYPLPLHLQKAYSDLGYGEGSFPVSERVAREVISLPMFPTLEERDIERVVEAVREFLREN